MARDDIFRIIYVILKELYEAQKAGKRIDPDVISSERFQIPPGYLAEGVEDLQSNSMMKKVHELLKDVKDIIPGI